MDVISIKDYVLHALEKGYLKKTRWYFELCTLHSKGYKGKYLKDISGSWYVKYEGDWLSLNSIDTSRVPLHKAQRIRLNKGDLPNVFETVDTSFGRLIANYIKLVVPFKDKFKFINKKFTTSQIEKSIPDMLKNEEITIQDYLKLADSVSFSFNLNKIFVNAASIKTITPPPELYEVKANLIKKYTKEYGDDWTSDANIAIKFKDELSLLDYDYLKDEPGFKKILSGKVLNNSRPRLYSTFGVEYGFDQTGQEFTTIMNSLHEGYPKDIDALAAIFNSARAASYLRGYETQQGGSMAKDTLRPTASFTIPIEDCGTTRTEKFFVTKNNYFVYEGSNIIENGETKLIKDGKKYIGKHINLRTPLRCESEGDSVCGTCVTSSIKNLKDGIPLLMIQGAGIILNAKMKGMHKATKDTIFVSLKDVAFV